MLTGIFARLFGLLCVLALGMVASHAEKFEPRYDESHIDHKQDLNWGKTVDRITKLSAGQNHGQPFMGHTCYAEADMKAYCATVVWYTALDGNQAFVRIIRRGDNNNLIARDVCRFNKSMSLRTCVNFDDGYTSKWTREKGKIDWKQIDRQESDDAAASGGL